MHTLEDTALQSFRKSGTNDQKTLGNGPEIRETALNMKPVIEKIGSGGVTAHFFVYLAQILPQWSDFGSK